MKPHKLFITLILLVTVPMGLLLSPRLSIAFIGGVLSLLSPCTSVLLPGYFAYAVESEKSSLFKKTVIFWLGLATFFIPLSLGGLYIGSFLNENLVLLNQIAGTIFIALAIFNLFEWRMLVKVSGNASRYLTIGQSDSNLRMYMYGLLISLTTGTCIAPILGGIITLGITSGNLYEPVILLLVYSLGLVTPLYTLASRYHGSSLSKQEWLRGKILTIPGINHQVHSTKLITSAIFLIIGLIFILGRGTHGLQGLFTNVGLTDLYLDVNQYFVTHMNVAPVILALMAIAYLIYYLTKRDV